MSYRVHNLWPVPVYQTTISGVDPITFEYLMNLEVSNFDEKNFTLAIINLQEALDKKEIKKNCHT